MVEGVGVTVQPMKETKKKKTNKIKKKLYQGDGGHGLTNERKENNQKIIEKIRGLKELQRGA